MKAKITRREGAEDVKFETLDDNDWFLYEGELHVKSGVVEDYDAVYFDNDGDVDAKSIDGNELVTPVQVTISY